MRRTLVWLAAATVLAPAALASDPRPVPTDVLGWYDSRTGEVALSWTPPEGATGSFRVDLGSERAGEGEGSSFRHAPPPDILYVYFVTVKLGDGSWSDAGVVAVAAPGCEVVSVTVAREYPFVHATVHEECLKEGDTVAYERTVTWEAPE
jgi:hypothetical protein